MKVVNIAMLSIGAIGIVMSGCSQEPPKCADEKTQNLVKEIVWEQARIESPSEQYMNDIFAIQFPRATEYDEKIKKYTCSAKLMFSEYELPIVYESQLDDHNEHIVSVNGIAGGDLYVIREKVKEEIAQRAVVPPKKNASRPGNTVKNIAGTWEGQMHDNTEGGVSMEIKSTSDGYAVSFGAGAPECGGEFNGKGVLNGNTMQILAAEGESPCMMKVVFDGDSAEVIEEDCTPYHGMKCDFGSTLTRID